VVRDRGADNRREFFQTGLVVDKLWLTHTPLFCHGPTLERESFYIPANHELLYKSSIPKKHFWLFGTGKGYFCPGSLKIHSNPCSGPADGVVLSPNAQRSPLQSKI
jgi:hypothetical protein